MILLCRFVPGGRMAACFSAGRSRYPYRLFLLYEAAGGARLGDLRRRWSGTSAGRRSPQSAWRLALIGGAAAAGFAGAGWAMTSSAPARAPRGARSTDRTRPQRRDQARHR